MQLMICLDAGRMEKQETESGNGHGKRKRTWKAETDVENGKIVRMLSIINCSLNCHV